MDGGHLFETVEYYIGDELLEFQIVEAEKEQELGRDDVGVHNNGGYVGRAYADKQFQEKGGRANRIEIRGTINFRLEEVMKKLEETGEHCMPPYVHPPQPSHVLRVDFLH